MTYLRNCWYVAGSAGDAGRTPIARTYLDENVMIYRTEGGEAVAMSQQCPHRFAPLDRGKLFGDIIECPYHGLRFDTAGRCVLSPTGSAPPPHARLTVYPLVERYKLLWIWMGEPALADPAAIPDFAYLEHPDFGWFDGYLHVNGNYQLLVDNLLDLTHAEFLHPFLSSPGQTGRIKPKVSQDGTRITVESVADNDNILPIMQQMRPDIAPIGRARQEERWDAPSLIRLSVEYYADGEQIIIPSGHFLTPETAHSTHYFVRGGHDVHVDNPQFTAGMADSVMNVFRTEDVPIIEAQQRFLGDAGLLDKNPAILVSDGGAIRVRRMLAKMIREEQAAATIADGPPVSDLSFAVATKQS